METMVNSSVRTYRNSNAQNSEFQIQYYLKNCQGYGKSSSRKVAKYLKCLKVLREKLQSFELGILTKFKQIALFFYNFQEVGKILL